MKLLLTSAYSAATACVLSLSLPLHAGTWDGGGSDGNTGNALNWAGDDLPDVTGASITFGGSLQTAVNNNYFEQLNGVTFAAGAGSFVVTGNALGNFVSNANILTNNSANLQTFGLNFGLTGGIGSEGAIVGVGGSHLILSGNISGTGMRLDQTSGTGVTQVTLSGNNTFTGQMVIGALVRLNIGSATGAGNGGNIRFNTVNSEFDNTSGGAITINNTLRFDRGGEFVGTDSVTTTGGLLLRRNLTASEAVTVSGSSLIIRNSFTNSDNNHRLSKDGAGTLVFASDVVTPTTWVGGIIVVQGAMIIDSDMSANTGGLDVRSGAVFGGSGSYGGAATITGSLRPGNSIGTFTMGNTVTWNGSASNAWVFELGAGNASDRLAIDGGQFLKGTGSDFVFDFAGAAVAGNFTLIEWTSEADLGGGALGTTFDLSDFSYVNLGGDLEGAFAFDGTALQFVVIPEPSAVAVLFSAIALIVVMRRRR